MAKGILKEFAKWLVEGEYYDAESVEVLLCHPWDGAYPTSLVGDDILLNIYDFLYYMAEFAVEKVFGKDYWKSGNINIRIVPEPSYLFRSYVYVLELNTKTVLAVGCGCKTWDYTPDCIEEDLEDLVKQLEESKGLLAVRMVSDS